MVNRHYDILLSLLLIGHAVEVVCAVELDEGAVRHHDLLAEPTRGQLLICNQVVEGPDGDG